MIWNTMNGGQHKVGVILNWTLQVKMGSKVVAATLASWLAIARSCLTSKGKALYYVLVAATSSSSALDEKCWPQAQSCIVIRLRQSSLQTNTPDCMERVVKHEYQEKTSNIKVATSFLSWADWWNAVSPTLEMHEYAEFMHYQWCLSQVVLLTLRVLAYIFSE